MPVSNIFNSKKGISLIEVVMAVTLLLIVVTALVRLGITTLNTADASRARSIAQQYADETMDYLRLLRDTNITTFFNKADGNYEWDPEYDVITKQRIIDTNINSTHGLVLTSCDPSDPDSLSTIGNYCDISVSINDQTVTFYRVINIRGLTGLNDPNAKELTIYIFWNNSGSYSNLKTSTILTRWRS